MNKFNLMWNNNGIEVSEALDQKDILTFSDGSIRVTLKKEILKDSPLSLEYAQDIKISAYVQGMDDLMVVAQIVDIIRSNTRVCPSITLQITSPVYSRYDRIMLNDRNDGFGAKVFVKFVKATGVNSVELYDPHSEVLGNLLMLEGIKVTSIHQMKLVHSTLGINEYIRVYPDKGSLKKSDTHHAYAPVKFDKVRSTETGRISGIVCVEGQGFISQEQDVPFLIIDDICEGGGTFLGVASEFWKMSNSANELQLHVTHGLFTNSAITKLFNEGYFSQVSAYIMKESTYNAIPDPYRKRVIVKHLVRGI